MATGDANDILSRLRALLPPWFPAPGSAPVIDGVLIGIAATLAFVFSLNSYVALQTRIKTATGAFIDLISYDYFGTNLPRGSGELDSSFSARVVAALVAPKVTRAAIISAVEAATGFTPRYMEPWVPTDVGAMDVGISFLDVDTPKNPGRLSNMGIKPAFFIEVPLPTSPAAGGNAVPALDVWTGATDSYAAFLDLLPTIIGADEVYAAINSTRAAGVTAWVKFVPAPIQPYWDEPGAQWDQSGQIWQ